MNLKQTLQSPLTILVGASVATVMAASCVPEKDSSQPSGTGQKQEQQQKQEDSPAYNTSPTADQFEVALDTKSKQCFGSAGCNVEVEPDITYNGALELDPSKTYEITYEVSGDRSGTVTETVELSNGDELLVFPSLLDVPSTNTPVTAEAVSVSEVSYW